MRYIVIKILLITIICMFAMTTWAAEKKKGAPGAAYTLAPGDVLDISIWKNQELSKLLTVLPDGKIHFPLVGEVMAQGKTVIQLKKELENRISRFVPNPFMSVVIQQTNSMQICVLGKVNEPGRFILTKNINVLQGLALAGGLNPFAEKNKIKILREEGGKTRIFNFKYNDVSKGKNMEQNIRLKRDDLIVVP